MLVLYFNLSSYHPNGKINRCGALEFNSVADSAQLESQGIGLIHKYLCCPKLMLLDNSKSRMSKNPKEPTGQTSLLMSPGKALHLNDGS